LWNYIIEGTQVWNYITEGMHVARRIPQISIPKLINHFMDQILISMLELCTGEGAWDPLVAEQVLLLKSVDLSNTQTIKELLQLRC